MSRLSALLLIALALALLPHRAAQAQVRQCTAADGSHLYTDRKCEDLGASEFHAPPAASAGSAAGPRMTCARSVQDLAYALESAAGSGDANRIAALYDWAGMGSSTANRIMDRLQAAAARATVGVQTTQAGASADAPNAGGQLIGLRLEQVDANGHTPAHINFGIRRRMGCLWVHL
jgi:hypothetical protein